MYKIIKFLSENLISEVIKKERVYVYSPYTSEGIFNYNYLVDNGYIEAYETTIVSNHSLCISAELPCRPPIRVTEKGYNFISEYESRTKSLVFRVIGIIVTAIIVAGSIATIIAFFQFPSFF